MTLADSGASAGPLGLLIVVLLGIVTVFLVRNMTGRLKKLPPTFEDRDKHGRPLSPPAPDDADDPSSGPTAGA